MDFDTPFSALRKQTILCIGDLMLDDFVYGDVTRISPEAPAPVIAVRREDIVIGGAGNVARNIASLGARCEFIGVIGDDAAGTMLRTAFAEHKGRIRPRLVIDRTRPTTRKLRFVSEHHSTHLLRADWELAKPVDATIEAALIKQVLAALPGVGAVVISDYAKGVLTPRVVRATIDAARKLNIPVVVDPKNADFSVYRGATMITPNRKELVEAIRRPLATGADVALAADELVRSTGIEAMLVTLSEDGMVLCARGEPPVHVPVYPVNVRDVSGAGDTVAAVLALMLSAGTAFEAAMRAANAAASVVVGKRGTATVTPAELRARILPSALLAPEQKIVFDWADIEARLAGWRIQDQRIGFTNGVFDLLHPGHVKVLAQSRATCDRLVVGLNSDASVRRLKGKERPIQNETARAEVLAALEAVDLVIIFGQDTPLELIRRVRPSVLVKGGDYRRDQVVGREIVEADGGEVVLVDLVAGHSTTRIVEKSRSSGSAEPKEPKPRGRASRKVSSKAAPRKTAPGQPSEGGLTMAAAQPTHADEERLVRAFFGGAASGFFVDVGAGHPTLDSQSWHLEQAGWTGILVEPQPDLAAFLITSRKAKVFAVACSSPDKSGTAMPLHVNAPKDGKPAGGDRTDYTIVVPARTLDEILDEAGAPQPIDLLCVGVGGDETEVLLGLDVDVWRPRLILIGGRVEDFETHRCLKESGYRLLRHFGSSGWYVPDGSPLHPDSPERWEILRTYYLALPVRKLGHLTRRIFGRAKP